MAENTGTKQIEQDKITIKVTLAGKSATFPLRMISMAEEMQLRQRYTGLTDSSEKGSVSDQEWQINVDALKEFSLSGDVQVDDPAEKAPHIPVAEFFHQRTPTKERMAEYAVRGFLSKLAPDVSFL